MILLSSLLTLSWGLGSRYCRIYLSLSLLSLFLLSSDPTLEACMNLNFVNRHSDVDSASYAFGRHEFGSSILSSQVALVTYASRNAQAGSEEKAVSSSAGACSRALSTLSSLIFCCSFEPENDASHANHKQSSYLNCSSYGWLVFIFFEC